MISTRLKNKVQDPNILLLIVGVIFLIGISVLVEDFLSFRNITRIIMQVSSTCIMAVGLTFVIITGGIDLSLPTVMALSGIFGCAVMAVTQNVFLGIIITLAVSTGIGCLNGFSVAVLKMVPMIVTLAVSTMALGISNWFTKARSISGMPESFSKIFAGDVFGVIPISVIILIIIAVIMHLLLTRTIFGGHLFQAGVNIQAAQVNGVKTKRVIFLAYMISGLMAGLAGIIVSARLNSAGPAMGPQNLFMDIVAAVVIGGASVNGGKGSIGGTIIGCIFIGTIANVMNLLSMEYYLILAIKGIIIVVVSYFDVVRLRIARAG